MAKMQSSKMSNKVGASALGAAVTTILLSFIPLQNLVQGEDGITTGLEAAIVTVVTFLLGYLFPPSSKDQVVISEVANNPSNNDSSD